MSKFGIGMEDFHDQEVATGEAAQVEDETVIDKAADAGLAGEEVPKVLATQVTLPPELDFATYDDSEINQSAVSDVIEDAIAEVQDVREGLEALKERMVEALANGGMSMESLDYAQIAMSNTIKKWVTMPAMPGMESATESGDMVKATGYAIEAADGMMRSAFRKIADLVKKWIESVKQTWHAMTMTAENLEKRSAELLQKATSNSGVAAKPKVSITGAEYKSLVKGGRFENVAEGLEGTVKLITNLTKESVLGDLMIHIMQELDKVAHLTPEQAVDAFDKIRTEIKVDHVIEKFITQSHTVKFKKSAIPRYQDTVTEKYLELEEPVLGDKTIVVQFTASKTGNLTEVEAIVVDGAHGHPLPNYDVPALNGTEVEKLAHAVHDLAAAITKAKVDIHYRTDVAWKIEGITYDIDQCLDSGATFDREVYHTLKAVVYNTAAFSMISVQPDLDIIRLSLASAKAAYNYAAKCLANLKAAEPAAPTEEQAGTTEPAA